VRWLQMDDADRSIIAFARYSEEGGWLLFISNWTPQVYYDYEVRVPIAGKWIEVLNSDAAQFGGSGVVASAPAFSNEGSSGPFILVSVPPLGASFWICED